MTHMHRTAVSLLEATLTIVTIVLLSLGFLDLLGYLFRTPPNGSSRPALESASNLEKVAL